jgi:subtilisin family serine protease
MRSLWPTVAVLAIVLAAISPGAPAHRVAAADLALGTPATPALANDPSEYVVIQSDAPLALYRGAIIGLAATNPEARGESRLDPSSTDSQAYLAYLSAQRTALVTAMSAVLLRQVSVGFTYSYAIAGFSTTLTPAEAATVATLPGVAAVHRQEMLEPLTDNGPKWMDADDIWDGSATGGVGTKGEAIVAGIIDTGINSDHPSFASPGPVDGYVYTNPRGHRFGLCAAGAGNCNDKLIGMYDFINGTSGEDDVGHGSHTASTVAGNVVDSVLYAPTITLGPRRISGVAPHANVIMYKACFAGSLPVLGGCPLTALIAAIDQATADVVDVVNFSIGGGSVDPWQDPLGLSFFGAHAAGVFVAASAGNSGPAASTMGRPANSPWVMAVGASTHDRRPTGRVQLSGGASAHADITGMTVSAGVGPLPLVDARTVLSADGKTNNELCNPFTDAQKPLVAGKIVVCTQGAIGRVQKGVNVLAAGGAGMVLIAQAGAKASVIADTHVLPASMISEFDGADLRTWLGSGTGHAATLVGTVLEESTALADRMAYFSSRGPDLNLTNVIKPDVTAPGVAIWAAFNTHSGPAGTPEYNIIQGTSMSSPHAAGAGALVRAVHRTWTPDQVKSALMSTGFTTPDGGKETVAVTKEDHATAADPFDRGGGRINIARAVSAGLTLEESVAGYQAANPTFSGTGAARSLNLASLANDDCRTTCSWTRTVTSTAAGAVTWTASATSTSGFALTVSPATFTLTGTQAITVTAKNTGLTPSFWEFGQLTFTPSDASLPKQHLPVAVKAKGAAPARTCFIPDTTVVTDPPDATVAGQPVSILPANDVREVGVAGVFPTFGGRPLPNVTFRMKVTDLSVLPPDAHWRIAFIPPGAPAGTSYFVQMVHGATGDPTFVYGTLAGGSFTVLGAPEAGTFTPDGTIKITIATGKFLSPGVGATLTGIIGASGPAVPGTLTTNTDSTNAGQYTLADCQNAELVISNSDIATAGEKENTTISAVVHNTGKSDAPSVVVRLLINGKPLSDQVVTVPAGQSAIATTGWNTKGLRGDFVITVVVDPDNAIPELDESNNSAAILVTVRGNRVQ